MNDDDLAKALSQMAGRTPEEVRPGYVGRLDYRPRDAVEPKPRQKRSYRWSNGLVVLGIIIGGILPMFVGILEPTAKFSDSRGWVIWFVLAMIAAMSGLLIRRNYQVEGFLAGLIIGTLIVGGLCGLLYAECGFTH